MEYIKSNTYLMAVKFISALLQAFATLRVFTSIFIDADYPTAVAYALAVLSVFLVDGLFLLVLDYLEKPEMSARQKLPWAAMAFLLLISILAIGFVDEKLNPLSFAPRLGLVGLVLAYLFVWFDQLRQERNCRDALEQKIRDEQALMRHTARQKAEKAAWNTIAPQLENRALVQAWDSMGMDDVHYRLQEINAVLNGTRLPLKEKRDVPTPARQKEQVPVTNDLADGVVQLSDGNYAWVDDAGKMHVKTSTGKPYTERGAQIALARSNGA